MPKISSKSSEANSLALRIKSSPFRVLMPISYFRYRSVNSDYVMDLSSSDKYSDYVRAHRFCDLITTESDYKLTSAFHSSRIMSIAMRRISSLHTLYVISY